MEKDYNNVIEVIDKIENCLKEIRESEKALKVDLSGLEEKEASVQERVLNEVESIKNNILESRNRLVKLESQLKESGRRNASLQKMVSRLEEELKEKTESLMMLQQELEKKNLEMAGMADSISELKGSLAELGKESESRRAELEKLENTVWYCVGSASELRESGILTRSPKRVLVSDFSRDVLVETDLRNLKSLDINSRRAKILTQHPLDSYTLERNENKMMVLTILDAEKFWSISKYLVVQR